MSDAAKLKPCPFCGSKDVALRVDADGARVWCNGCLALGPPFGRMAQESAVLNWMADLARTRGEMEAAQTMLRQVTGERDHFRIAAAEVSRMREALERAADLVRGLRKSGISTERAMAPFVALLDWLDDHERRARAAPSSAVGTEVFVVRAPSPGTAPPPFAGRVARHLEHLPEPTCETCGGQRMIRTAPGTGLRDTPYP